MSLSLFLGLALRANDFIVHFTMTKTPRRPLWRPHLLPFTNFNAENTCFLPPSSLPIVRYTRTIWAAIKLGPSPVAFATVSFESTSSARWHRYAVVNLLAAQATQTSPIHTITLKLQVTLLEKMKWWVGLTRCVWFLNVDAVSFTHSRTQHQCCCQSDSRYIHQSIARTLWS